MDLLVTKMLYKVGRNGIEVFVYGRTDTGHRKRVVITDARPYFYVREEPKPHSAIVRTERKGQDLLNQPLWKIHTKIPRDVRALRDMYDYHFEADIPFTDRVRIDYGIRSQIRVPDGLTNLTKDKVVPVDRTIYPEILYLDIETDDSKGFAHPDYAAHHVPCLDMYSTQYKSHILLIDGKVDKEKIRRQFKELCQKHFNEDGPPITVKECIDERQLFQKFRSMMTHINPDIITGWNVDFYDIGYLQNRAQNKLYSRPDFRIHASFDLMKGYDRLHIGKSFMKLEHVAQKELGVGKLPRERISEMFKHDKNKLCLYNIWDVEITRRIDLVRNIINRHLAFAWFAGADIEKSYHSEPLFDKYILHEVAGRVMLPSKDMLKTTGVDKGAYVDTPVSGRYNYVGLLDFASMYPKTIISFNVSPETRLADDYEGDIEHFTLPSGRKYKKEPMGFIPIIVSKLLGVRESVKDEMKKFEKGTPEYKRKYQEQTAIKYFINSAYGIMGSEIFRLADGDVASDVTHVGRVLIHKTMELVGNMGLEPLYADTDSVFFETGASTIEEAVEISMKVEESLNNYYPKLAAEWSGAEECQHHIKCEKIYEAWMQAGAKKRHAGIVGWDVDTEDKFITHLPPEQRLDVKGFEIVRANVASVTKGTQKDIIIKGLTEKDYWNVLSKYLINLKEEFYAGKHDTNMLIPASYGKTDYKTKPAHIRAREYSEQNNLLILTPGDPYSWLYVKHVTGKPATDVTALELEADTIPNEVIINYNKMWDRCIAKPLVHILDALNVSMEELLSGRKQVTLDLF